MDILSSEALILKLIFPSENHGSSLCHLFAEESKNIYNSSTLIATYSDQKEFS